MIVSGYNLYVPPGILLLSKFMNPLNTVNANCGSLKALSVWLQRIEKELCTHLSHIPLTPDRSQDGFFKPSAVKTFHLLRLCVLGRLGLSKGFFCQCRCYILHSGKSHNLAGACTHVKGDTENRRVEKFSVLRAESVLN